MIFKSITKEYPKLGDQSIILLDKNGKFRFGHRLNDDLFFIHNRESEILNKDEFQGFYYKDEIQEIFELDKKIKELGYLVEQH